MSPIGGEHMLRPEEEEKRSQLSSSVLSQDLQNIYDEDIYEPLRQKIMEKRLLTEGKGPKTNPKCKCCRNLEEKFYVSESKSLSQAIENFKLRKIIRDIIDEKMKNSDSRIASPGFSTTGTQNNAVQ